MRRKAEKKPQSDGMRANLHLAGFVGGVEDQEPSVKADWRGWGKTKEADSTEMRMGHSIKDTLTLAYSDPCPP